MIELAKFKVFLYGQDKTARRQRRFRLAQRARRVRRRGKPPKQLNPQTWAIARINLFLHGATDFKIVRGDTLRNPAFYAGDNLATFGCVIATARRDSASNPAKPDAADGKRPNDTFFKN